MMFRFRLVRIAHLLLQGVTSLGGVVPESLDRPGRSFIRALLLLSGFRLFRTMCCLLFPVFLFSSLALLMRSGAAGGSWAQCMGCPLPIVALVPSRNEITFAVGSIGLQIEKNLHFRVNKIAFIEISCGEFRPVWVNAIPFSLAEKICSNYFVFIFVCIFTS